MTRGATAYLIGGILGLVLLAVVKTCSAGEAYRTLDMYPSGVQVEEIRDIWSSELTDAAISRRPEANWVFISLTDSAVNDVGVCHYYALATTERVRNGALPFDEASTRFSTLGHEMNSNVPSCNRLMLQGFQQSARRLSSYLEQQPLPTTKASR